MSIEELFKAVVAALEANTKAVAALEASLAGRTPAKSADRPKAEAKQDKAEAKQEKTPDPKVGESDTASAADVKLDSPADSNEAVTPLAYETVRNLVLKLAPTKRDAIKALNAKHGIANLKVLLDKEDDFSTVNDQAKLEAVYADLQALEA
jgi:uncharacterized membrane protein